ncbi:MAG TPA: hypothetical protein VMH61_06135 [Candidatus Acidoferrales bacterium]|nr:hypothetical protein [Candidatus Acidoferrales bacterium]
MSRVAREAPRLLLGATSLELPARTTRDRALEVAGRFREPESLAVTMIKALDAGAEGVYAVPSSRMRAALRELRRPVPVLVRLPLTPAADDLHYEHALLAGPPGGENGGATLNAGLSRLGSLSGDLAARIIARCDGEAPALGARAWAGVAFAAPLTDLALAAGHARAFERLVRHGRSRYGLAGFETHNLVTLLARLREWGIAPDFVIAAFNPRGVGMPPDYDAVLEAVRAAAVPVIATELRAGGIVSLAEGAAFAREHGAHGIVPELVDLEDVASELAALTSAAGR